MRSLRSWVKQHPRLTNLMLLGSSIIFALILFEVIFRIALPFIHPHWYEHTKAMQWSLWHDKKIRLFQPHPYLTYTRADTNYLDDYSMQIADQVFSRTKPDNTLRVACLGGSTTMDNYPLFLYRFLERNEKGLKIESMDFGCSGWTLQESMLNYIIRVQDYNPYIVFFNIGANDGAAFIWPGFKPDYSHYRKQWEDPSNLFYRNISRVSMFACALLLRQGKLPWGVHNFVVPYLSEEKLKNDMNPDAYPTFLRNLKTLYALVKSNNSKMVLAPMAYNPDLPKPELNMFSTQNQLIKQFARENQVPLVDTHHILMNRAEEYADQVHVNFAGTMTKTCLYAAMIKDVHRGYSEIYDPLTDTYSKRLIKFQDKRWKKRRWLDIRWQYEEPDVRGFHIYMQSNMQREFVYIGRVGENERRFIWGNPNYKTHPDYRYAPHFDKMYYFMVYALHENGEHELIGPAIEPGKFEIIERMILTPNL